VHEENEDHEGQALIKLNKLLILSVLNSYFLHGLHVKCFCLSTGMKDVKIEYFRKGFCRDIPAQAGIQMR